MPFIDLCSKDDYANIFYRTNTAHNNVGGFDPEKPTIIMLHRMWMDASWMHHHFNDPRLSSNYNIIAFDQRTSGQSSSRPSGKVDVWTDAADLAFCLRALLLPACHFLTSEAAGHVALRFSTLFPELCLSITLLNMPPPTELNWQFTAYDELLQRYCFAEDFETLEHAAMECTAIMLGSNPDPDVRDDIIAFWCGTNPPKARLRILSVTNTMMNRAVLKASILAKVVCPVMIVQGERSQTCPVRYAEKLQGELVNASGGAILYTVKGTDSCLSLMPENASISNQVINKFLSRLPPAQTILRRPSIPTSDRMYAALRTLADMHDDPSMETRDPWSPLSFSCVSAGTEKSQSDSLEFYAKGLDKLFSPVGPNGRPLRLYSRRMEELHWFSGGHDGLSHAGSEAAVAQAQRTEKLAASDRKTRHTPDRAHGARPTTGSKATVQSEASKPVSELISTRAAADASLQRVVDVNVRRNTVEKVVIKGSMSKVVSANGSHLQKLLL